jgi:hypothetical protein
MGLAATVHLQSVEFPLETAMFGKVQARWLLAAILGATMCQPSTGAQPGRKVVSRVKPAYPNWRG